MKTVHLFILMLAAGFVACSNDDDNSIQQPAEERLPLTIEVAENPMVNPDEAADAPATRAAIITTSTLDKFNINYVYGANYTNGDPITAKKDTEGKWTSGGSWPTASETIDWYASSDGTFNEPSNPYINFTVEENASTQKDLLVAKTPAKYADNSGKVTFTFDHVCTALRFLVKKATNLDDYTLSITEVKLCNVKNNGLYYFNSHSWESLTVKQVKGENPSYTLYSGSAKTLGTTDYEVLDASDAPYLFMIPQPLTPWDGTTAIASATEQTYIQITCTIMKDGNNVHSGTAYIPFGATLTAGYQHDVKINIGKNSLYSGPDTKIIN